MSNERLTAILAERVMGWRVVPERFMTGGRGWLPRWRFQPFVNLEDAFRLLDAAAAKYTLAADFNGRLTARVWIGNRAGMAAGRAKAATITRAVAQAIGVSVPDQMIEGAHR